MKLYFTTLLFILAFFYLEVNAQELKICTKGIERCKPLKNYPDKFNRCMRIICFQDEKPVNQPKKNEDETKNFNQNKNKSAKKIVKICENGKKRCDILSEEPEFFWQCLDETCRNPELKIANASCVEGHLACKPELDEYQSCVKLNCGEAKECEKSKRFCNDGLRRYWRCVHKICIGPAEHFRKRKPMPDKEIIIQDEKTGKAKKIKVKKRQPILSGAAVGKLSPPKGISPEEWIRDIPSEFIITGNPSKYMKCLNPEAVIECRTRDIRSCGCSDGKAVVIINGIPKPYKLNEN